MNKLFKKLSIIIFILSLPLLIIGCGNDSGVVGGEIKYFLTPKQTEIEIIRGETYQLEYDTNITDLIEWESFNEEIATVDENGVVTAIKTGQATILCYSMNLEFEVIVTVKPKPATIYTLTIDGFANIETTKKGVALIYLLQQQYGSKMHPDFGEYIFQGYYSDKALTKELDLYTQLSQSLTIYPKLEKDNTQCDLMFSISNTLFFGDELVLNDGIQVLTPDYSSNTKNINFNYNNTFMVVVEFDYNSHQHYVTNTYLDGDKQNVTIPYNGFVILIQKDNEQFNKLYESLKIGTKIDLDKYSINVANRVYINKQYTPTKQEEININVTSLYSSVYDFTNKQYLYQKSAAMLARPASTTKIITAIAAVQNAPLDLKIIVGDELDFMYEGSTPGTAGSKKGQVWTLRQLLYAMLLPSGNDSAYTIAAGVARSLPGNENKSTKELLQIFNDLMNKVRDQVGANGSNFMVPDGNSYYNSDGSWEQRLTNHYVTANDMIKFAIMAFNCPGIAKVTSTSNISFKLENGESYVFSNTNSLIKPANGYYNKYVVGLKTGTTTPAGACLIFGAEKDGRFIIGAVMKSENRYSDATLLLKKIGFN